ncbi:MAG: hypothetical protein R2730_08485 [Chitinophagales bacterium]
MRYINDINDVKNDFGGPSLYFHNRALEECTNNPLSDKHLEYIYATLASWGMHRMGKTKTKMVDFHVFRDSILSQKKSIYELMNSRIENLNNNKESIFKELRKICFSIKVSVSDSKIVGNSKALAHILPNLVPPIDRQYTIRFFTQEGTNFVNGNGKLKAVTNFKNIEDEKEIFLIILDKTCDFTCHIIKNEDVRVDKIFNTSYPKIFDNFIISYIRRERNIIIK